jgi:hypothetical protein
VGARACLDTAVAKRRFSLSLSGFEVRQSSPKPPRPRLALGPTQPPIQCVPGALSPGLKRLGDETDRSHPSSAEVKKCVELCLHSPLRLHGVVLT